MIQLLPLLVVCVACCVHSTGPPLCFDECVPPLAVCCACCAVRAVCAVNAVSKTYNLLQVSHSASAPAWVCCACCVLCVVLDVCIAWKLLQVSQLLPLLASAVCVVRAVCCACCVHSVAPLCTLERQPLLACTVHAVCCVHHSEYPSVPFHFCLCFCLQSAVYPVC